MKKEGRADAKARARKKAKDVRLLALGAGQSKANATEATTRALMRDHFDSSSSIGQNMFSLKRKAVSTQALADAMHMAETKKKRLSIEKDDDDLGLDCDMGEPENANDDIYMKVVIHNIGTKHVLPVVVGAGGRLKQKTMAVTMHQLLQADDGSIVLATKPLAVGPAHESVLVTDVLEGDIKSIEEPCVCWQRGRMGGLHMISPSRLLKSFRNRYPTL